MIPTPELTTAQKLAKVIEAMGGCADCFQVTDGNASVVEWQGDPMPVIGLLLMDTEALRRAFGNQKAFYPFDPVHATGEEFERYRWVARSILNAWLSKPEGDPVAMINTAFSLLP